MNPHTRPLEYPGAFFFFLDVNLDTYTGVVEVRILLQRVRIKQRNVASKKQNPTRRLRGAGETPAVGMRGGS